MKFKFDLPMPDDDRVRAEFIPRVVGKGIDLIIALTLWKIPGAVGAIAAMFYLFVADGFSGGQSIGKRLVGLRVVRLDGEPFDFTSSILRNITLVIPFGFYLIPAIGHFLAYTLGIALLLFELYFCLYNDEGMRVGDTISSTTVVSDEALEVVEEEN